MPGVVARIGGRPPQPGEIDDVLASLRHFHFYGSESSTCEHGWLGWVGIGAGDRRVLPTPVGRKLVVHDGDGAAWHDADRQRTVATSIADLVADRPYDLAASLGGSFSASCLDLDSGEFHCITDLFGHRRVYYRQLGDTLYLACELKSFLGWPEFPVEADPVALRDLMNYSYPMGDRTSLEGVKLLQPASQLSFRDGVLTVRRYWRPHYQPQEGDDDQLIAEGYRLFSETFAQKTANAPKLIIPVSGGLDSRMLLSEALKTGADPYTYTFGHSRSREAAESCHIMEHMGVQPRHIQTDDFPDAIQTLQRTSWFGEGMVDMGTALITRVAGDIAENPQRAFHDQEQSES